MATQELRVLLRMIADTTGAQQTQQALRQTQRQTERTGRAHEDSLIRRAGTALAAKVSIEAMAAALGDAIQVTREHERVVRATAAAYGAGANEFTRYAEQLSAATGFTSDAILEAALSARTLSQNYGLTTQQTQKLISVSADLARVRGIGIEESFERVQSAIRGEAEASEYLGLTLNDTYLTNQALNGSLKNTFGTMTDNQKAQVRYNELLRQSAQFAGLAASQTNSLDGAMNRAATGTHKLQLALGELIKPEVVIGLGVVADAADVLARALGMPGALGGPTGLGAALAIAAIRRAQDQRDAAEAAKGLRATESQIERGQRGFAPAMRANVTVISRELADLKDRATAADVAQQTAADGIGAAWQALVTVQDKQLALQRESVNLSAEEARIKLSLLPAQQQMAALQRDITEQQLRARQAALPASRALEDLRYEQQRLQLTLASRRAAPEERSDIRRQLRGITRAMPGTELDALLAGRGETLAGRAAEDIGIRAQLLDIAGQRALADVQGAQQQNQFAQAIGAAVAQAQEQVLQGLVNQVKFPTQVTVNITHEDGRTETYTELIEANRQAQLPTVIQQSGLRPG